MRGGPSCICIINYIIHYNTDSMMFQNLEKKSISILQRIDYVKIETLGKE